MHDIQKVVLKRLLDRNGQKYAQLTRGYSYEENVVFHLKQLIGKGLITKTNGNYSITAQGIKEITGFDLNQLADTGFKTFFFGFLCSFQNKYLIKEHPQGPTNFYNLPSGKPNFGETVEVGLVRTFASNTGLTLSSSTFRFLTLHMKTVKTSAGEVLFDDAFAIYEVSLTEEQFKQSKLLPALSWKSNDEIKDLDNRWPELDICIISQDLQPYKAYDFVSDYIL